jgi:hypothetical protein
MTQQIFITNATSCPLIGKEAGMKGRMNACTQAMSLPSLPGKQDRRGIKGFASAQATSNS